MNCATCGRLLDNPDDPMSLDCGGDCQQCMADVGDPDCQVPKPIMGEVELEVLLCLVREMRRSRRGFNDYALSDVEAAELLHEYIKERHA